MDPVEARKAKDRIVDAALDLGFTAVGVAPARLANREADRLGSWLEAGHHGGMGWMAREPKRRTDMAELLPGARSVVMAALNYYSPPAESEPGRGRISIYAESRDYHRVIKGLWKKLMPVIEAELPGVRGKWFVDSGPPLEKAFAELAGIGWRGKHSNVIAKKRGSWFFLGGIVLDAELTLDEPAVNHCGSCTACIEACPTDAIVEPYVVDARRCISYLTIEHRGEEPPGHAGESGDWVFGCDICQEVCPWNRFAEPTGSSDLEPRAEIRSLTLKKAAGLGRDGFDQLFEGTPVRRAGWDLFRKSVDRAMENQRKDGRQG